MKKISALILILFLATVLHPQIQPRAFQTLSGESLWENIGPEGGLIQEMTFNPKTTGEIFALTSFQAPSQVFKSTDEGKTWQRIATLFGRCFDIALDPSYPNRIYVLGNSGVFRSDDGGSSWKDCRFGIDCSSDSGELAVDPNNPGVVYAAGSYYDSAAQKCYMAAFKSSDNGETWTQKKIAAGSSAYAFCLSIHPLNPQIIYASGYYYDGSKTRYKIFKSLDAGNTWIDVSGPIEVRTNKLVVDPNNPSKIHAATSWGMYRSADGGQTWLSNNQVNGTALTFDSANPGVLYCGYNTLCYKSNNSGETWTLLSGAFLGNCTSLLASSERVYYGSTAGITRSRNSGTSWETGHAGMKAAVIPALTISPFSPNIIYAEVEGNGFYKSQDFGNTWNRVPDIPGCTANTTIRRAAINPFNAQVILALLSTSVTGGG